MYDFRKKVLLARSFARSLVYLPVTIDTFSQKMIDKRLIKIQKIINF